MWEFILRSSNPCKRDRVRSFKNVHFNFSYFIDFLSRKIYLKMLVNLYNLFHNVRNNLIRFKKVRMWFFKFDISLFILFVK